MPIHVINQDITKVDEIFNCNGFALLHIGNCKNRMGAGVAKQICNKWPQVKLDYHTEAEDKGLHISHIIQTDITDLQTVYTLLAQENYGNDGRKYISYEALELCLQKVVKKELQRKLLNINEKIPEDISRNIYIPFRMGAGLAGGRWDIVLSIIQEQLKEFKVYVCKL